MQPNFRFGFRIVGGCHNERRLVDADAAFVAHLECDPQAETDSECFLSAFCFDAAFARRLNSTGTTKGFDGPTWARWLWFDIDRAELQTAIVDVQKLVSTLLDSFDVAGDELLIFFSGSKGFHVGLPTALWNPQPAVDFHLCCRQMAEGIARDAGVAIDSGVYDRVRAFRAPNSRHGKTGLHKRFIALESLMRATPARICELSTKPWALELPTSPTVCARAVRHWTGAVEAVRNQTTFATERRRSGTATVTRSTLAFIRDGATNGDRHRLLFSAAANLAEFGCGFELAWGLLSESALDSGLAPSEVRRQIECGLNHGRGTG